MIIRLAVILIALIAWAPSAEAERLRLAVTTSFQNSGLADELVPRAESALGIDLQLLVVGTGQALRLGRAGDVDAVLVHSRADEEAFVSDGYGTHRREIMYNDFILVGPEGDPADVAGAGSASDALARIAAAEAPFVSRGDDSGTHLREQMLWAVSGVTPEGRWYRPVGAGMGAALNTSAAMGAYALTDRASWLAFGNRRSLVRLLEGDPALFNQYTYLPVNPAIHPHANAGAALAFEQWLTSTDTQEFIGSFELEGEPLFVPNARAEEGATPVD